MRIRINLRAGESTEAKGLNVKAKAEVGARQLQHNQTIRRG